MLRYIVIAPEGSTVLDAEVTEVFGPNVYMINESAWAVGTPLLTCGDVRDHLHTGGDRTCVVVKAEEFNGYAPQDLWEKLAVWAG